MSELLESTLGDNTVVFNSVQNAVQACMEMLGTRTSTVSVMLPVTTPVDAMSGVMRGGAQPIILDLDEDTLQMDHKQVLEVLQELKDGAVMLLSRSVDKGPTKELREATEEYPCIFLNDFTPHPQDNHWGDFNIYDLSPWIGCGAVIRTNLEEQLKDLKIVRGGVLGLGAELPEVLGLKARESMDAVVPVERDVALLHQIEEIKRRWLDLPSYPVAERAYNGKEEKEEADSSAPSADDSGRTTI